MLTYALFVLTVWKMQPFINQLVQIFIDIQVLIYKLIYQKI